jgi:hypothetical protein
LFFEKKGERKMSKVSVVGNAAVITSSLKLEDIKLLEKYRPKALMLMGGEDGKEPIFRVGTGAGTINEYGVSFDGETRDDNKLATLTIVVDTDRDIKEALVDNIGAPVMMLNKVEKAAAEVVDEVKNERKEFMDSINVI